MLWVRQSKQFFDPPPSPSNQFCTWISHVTLTRALFNVTNGGSKAKISAIILKGKICRLYSQVGAGGQVHPLSSERWVKSITLSQNFRFTKQKLEILCYINLKNFQFTKWKLEILQLSCTKPGKFILQFHEMQNAVIFKLLI